MATFLAKVRITQKLNNKDGRGVFVKRNNTLFLLDLYSEVVKPP